MLINTHSYYSLNYGCLSIEEVLTTAQTLGHQQLAITDINNTSEVFRFLKLAPEYNIQASIGIDFRKQIDQLYIGIAKSHKGFYELNKHLSHHLENKIDFDPTVPNIEEAFFIYPIDKAPKVEKLRQNEYVGIKASDLKRSIFKKYWSRFQHKVVVLCTSTFRNKRDFNTHRLLRAIGGNTLLSKLSKEQQAEPTDLYLSKIEIDKSYAEHETLIKNTQKLLSDSRISFDFELPRNNRKCFTNSPKDDIKLLKELTYAGLSYRYNFSSANSESPAHQNIIKRLENELDLIERCNFCAYFLINWDMIQYAIKKGYPYVGRGSGANSLVAYLLKITNVDPIDLDLYFERFINPYRTSPPDFDIDFSWTDRDDITQYLFQKYKGKIALLGSYQTYQTRAVIRELGKVFGLPDEEIQQLQRNSSPKDEYGKVVKKYSAYIAGFPSHLSIHASGILISEKSIHFYSSTHLPPKNFPTVHFDMQIAEDIGLHKYDILSQRGLGKINDAVKLIEKNHQKTVDIHQIEHLKRDPAIKKLMKAGDLTGCFYVESPAMRMLMTKLKAEDYTRLVAASSIIRPGVAKSGMMREYILRFQNKERRATAQKALPELYQILEETYGVMVYQEDVIKVAHFFAELTLAEADILRRGMSWKFKQRNEFHKVKERFFDNCHRKGHPSKTINNIWEQIESFANFAFSKGHSASYAVESFQALYLHAYYPLEYLTATLNNGGGFYSIELYVHTAKMKGAIVEPPCINQSMARATIYKNTIHLGLSFIRGGFERDSLKRILEERLTKGKFSSFRNFVDRMPGLSLEQTLILIRIGCFRTLESNKKKLLWDAHFLLSENPKASSKKRNLFQIEPKKWTFPELLHSPLEDAYDQIEFLGFPLNLSPFDLIEDQSKRSQTSSRDLKQQIGKVISITGYLVHAKSTKAKNKQLMQFATFIDQKGEWIDAVIFPNRNQQNRYLSRSCYNIKGKVSEEFGHISLEVFSLERLYNKVVNEVE